jgi:hypothetical protein
MPPLIDADDFCVELLLMELEKQADVIPVRRFERAVPISVERRGRARYRKKH